MKSEIKVPAMGESITEATVGSLLKPSGSHVSTDDEVLELETDKVNQVLYAPQTGTVTIHVKEGDHVKIGQVIGFVEDSGSEDMPKPRPEETKAAPAPKTAKETTPSEPAKETPVKPEKEAPPAKSQQEPASSSDSSGARMTKQSFVESLAGKESPPQSKQSPQETKPKGTRGETRKKMSRIRKVIAARLVEVQHNTAMLTTFNEVDLTQVITLREKYKESFAKTYGARLGFMSFFVKACVSALLAHPEINSYIDGEDLVTREYIDIGIAVGTERGLIVPVVRDCDTLSFSEIEKAIEGFAKKAREGGLSADDLRGGGFTITNGGTYGSMLSTPILNPPQSAILGMHKIMKRPVVVDDEIVIRQMMYLALSYDHRVVDGKEAVTFLVHIKNFLEDPARLLLEI